MTFLIIILLVVVFWPWITRLVRRLMARGAENAMRRMMGMPSRKEEERARKAREKTSRRRRAEASGRRSKEAPTRAATMMQAVAVDVEYTEIREYSSETRFGGDSHSKEVKSESQVSDADYKTVK